MPRRPSTANDAGPSRLPFPSAEALLWGPEMKKQHAYLLTEMRTLQKQHEVYDTRIRATEAIAEAVEATAAQMRDLEQQLAAIEARDDNKAFEKWTSDEITRLGFFVDANKNMRQELVELDAKVEHVSEHVDRFLRGNVGFEHVLRRLDLLELDRREDAKRIQGLEKEVHQLKCGWESSASYSKESRMVLESREETKQESIRPPKRDAEIPVIAIESDNEEILHSRVSTNDEIQVPHTHEVPETNHSDISVVKLPDKGPPIMSARKRLLERPSIHDAKLPRQMEEQNAQPSPDELPHPGLHRTSPPLTQLVSRWHRHDEAVGSSPPEHSPPPVLAPAPLPVLVPAPLPTSTPQHQVHQQPEVKAPKCEAPSTKLIDRKPPGKRKQPDSVPPTQIQTRSQTRKNQTKGVELQATTGSSAASETEPVRKTEPASPPRKKLKATRVNQRAENKSKSSRTGPTNNRNTKKTQNEYKVEEPDAHEPVPTKAAASHKKRPPSASIPPARKNTKGQKHLLVKICLGWRAQEVSNP